jgi:hypothetical protein
MDRCFLAAVPEDILQMLATYLIPVDKQSRNFFRFSTEWRNFMNSSKEHFGRWKKRSQLLVLNWLYSRKLYSSNNTVLESGEQPRNQLVLNFVFPDRPQPLIQQVSVSVKVLNMKISCLADSVRVENLSDLDTEEVSSSTSLIPTDENMPTVRKLTVTNSNIAEGTYLQYLDELSITGDRRSGLHFKNYHLLSNLSKICLTNCQTITDLTCFRKVRHLLFRGCHQFSDVRCLT